MKKHFLGILILLITFGIGFSVSPIRFSVFAVGSSMHGGFTSFESTDFVKVVLIKEPKDTSQEAEKSFEKHKKKYEEIVFQGKILEIVNRKVLISKKDRAIISTKTKSNLNGFCSIRKDGSWVFEICSESLWHVLEFEKQYIPKN